MIAKEISVSYMGCESLGLVKATTTSKVKNLIGQKSKFLFLDNNAKLIKSTNHENFSREKKAKICVSADTVKSQSMKAFILINLFG